jgi:CheY-like chemotaxis protein
MQKQECNAADLMTQAVEELYVMAEKAEVGLAVTPQAGQLWADPDRIVQILTNLLSNAIKFSRPGGTVWLSAELLDGHLRFAVTDQGRGIPADKLESIFGRFQQVDASDSREKGGTGLGLAICHSIVQQHGGRIWVESTLGEGSTFFFTLPVLSRVESLPLDLLPHAEQRTVLVCDDNPVIGELMKAMLEDQGYQAVITTSGPDALQQAARLRPAAILLDLLMPGMDGWQTASALQEMPETCAIPIIVTSGLSSQEVKNFPTSISAWLCKPVDGEALLHALKHTINGQNKTACMLVAEGDVDLAKVIITMLQRHGIESFYARTGREAIQLCQHVSPDLLILDPGLPDGDGFMVVNWFRQQNSLRQVPLVVYSAKDLDVDERERLKLGPTQFFTKGRVTPEEFEQRVVGFLNHILAQRGGDQSNGNQAYFGH